ncbi:hypothetical protein [Nostoc sp.]|uniref:hypothetical protein n=1 Tax=Nostoc sp. TaxID=1180 RepID=UPI002FFB059E
MLYSKILYLRQNQLGYITINPLLNAFSLDMCQEIDAAENDDFIRKARESILTRLKDYEIGYSVELQQALCDYSEAATYLSLKNKGLLLEKVPENTNKTPDLKVNLEGKEFFIEIKTLGFGGGEENDIQAMEQGLDAQVSIEEQLKAGNAIATAVTAINPLKEREQDCFYSRQKDFIETIIRKIKRLIKKGQFEAGSTILLIDLSLIPIPADWKVNSIPIFPLVQNQKLKNLVSGILWYSAFGKENERIFSPIEFEGDANIKSELSIEGILNKNDFIKALCFQVYNLRQERKIVGFYRAKDEDFILPLIDTFCDFVNDEMNTNGWRILETFLVSS